MSRHKQAAQYAHVVSFRLTDEQALHAEELRASFEDQTWAEMGRWLFSDKRVLALMREQIREGGVETELEITQAWEDDQFELPDFSIEALRPQIKESA